MSALIPLKVTGNVPLKIVKYRIDAMENKGK